MAKNNLIKIYSLRVLSSKLIVWLLRFAVDKNIF